MKFLARAKPSHRKGPSSLSPFSLLLSPCRNNRGQYIPISLMVMFTMVVFMTAVVNVYKVARAKLEVQNIADAAALNLTSQLCKLFNTIPDRNEWLNHLYVEKNEWDTIKNDWQGRFRNRQGEIAQIINQHQNEDANSGDQDKQLQLIKNNPKLNLPPPIAFVENDFSGKTKDYIKSSAKDRYVFNSKLAAEAYANLVKTVNDSQKAFVKAYMHLLGMSGSVSNQSMVQVLKNDIQILGTDPNISFFVWNSADQESAITSIDPKDPSVFSGGGNRNNITKIFNETYDASDVLQIKNVSVSYFMDVAVKFGPDKKQAKIAKATLGELAGGGQGCAPVGWMTINWNAARGLNPPAGNPAAAGKKYIGFGVMVIKRVDMGRFIPTQYVKAKAQAYVVPSGRSGGQGEEIVDGGVRYPVFKPTYYVKLLR